MKTDFQIHLCMRLLLVRLALSGLILVCIGSCSKATVPTRKGTDRPCGDSDFCISSSSTATERTPIETIPIFTPIPTETTPILLTPPSLNLEDFILLSSHVTDLVNPAGAIHAILPSATVIESPIQDTRYTAIVVGNQSTVGVGTEQLTILEAKTEEDAAAMFANLYTLYRSQGLIPTYMETDILALENNVLKVFLVKHGTMVFTLLQQSSAAEELKPSATKTSKQISATPTQILVPTIFIPTPTPVPITSTPTATSEPDTPTPTSTLEPDTPTHTPIPATATRSPSPTITKVTPYRACNDAPNSRLVIGMRAQVSKDPPLSNRVRQKPNTSSIVLGKIGPGEIVTVIDGPSCGENFVWWYIRANNGLTGWTVEGDFLHYWLIPIYP